MTGHEHDVTSADARRDGTDPTVARAWREASAEQPAAAIDAVILAAASASLRRAESQRTAPSPAVARTPRSLERWQPFAVAASVAVLAFVLVQTMPREPGGAVPASSRPQVTSSDSAVTSPVEPRLRADRANGEAVPLPAQPPAEAPAVAAPAPVKSAATAPSAPLEKARPEVAEPTVTAENGPLVMGAAAPDPRQDAVMDRAATAEAAPAPAPAQAARASSSRAEEGLDPAAWAARIAALYSAGKLDEAARSLRDFRAVQGGADSYLPPAVRDWARTVE